MNSITGCSDASLLEMRNERDYGREEVKKVKMKRTGGLLLVFSHILIWVDAKLEEQMMWIFCKS